MSQTGTAKEIQSCNKMKTSRLKTGTGFAAVEKKHVKPLNQIDRTLTHVNTENGNAFIHQKLNRILQIDTVAEPVSENVTMISKVTLRPNPFSSAIALEVSCQQSKHIIIRMTDPKERIVKMISWFVVKGANVTSLTELDNLEAGTYSLDVMDQEGELLFSTDVEKK